MGKNEKIDLIIENLNILGVTPKNREEFLKELLEFSDDKISKLVEIIAISVTKNQKDFKAVKNKLNKANIKFEEKIDKIYDEETLPNLDLI